MSAKPSAKRPPTKSRKSGTGKGLVRRAGQTVAERQLVEKIIEGRRVGLELLRAQRIPNEPLLVYGCLPFPILFNDYLAKRKKRVPRWDMLSQWMKLQIIILAFQEWDRRFLTFTVRLNRKKESEIIPGQQDIRRLARD